LNAFFVDSHQSESDPRRWLNVLVIGAGFLDTLAQGVALLDVEGAIAVSPDWEHLGARRPDKELAHQRKVGDHEGVHTKGCRN
jgi:hypothetical protein